MDIILECILEIILEGSIELSSSKKVPMPLRILAALLFLLIYGFIVAVFVYCAYSLLQDGDTGLAVFVFLVAAFIAIGCIELIVKKFRTRRK